MIDDRLVHNSSQILRLLLYGKSSVNDIIKQTSIYKNYVFAANRFLEQSGFVVRTRDKGIHEQKAFIELTEFGHKLARFIENTDRFDRSFETLSQTIKNNFDVQENVASKTLRSLLRNRGWSDDEMNHYDVYEKYTRLLEKDCLSVLIHGITNLYGQYLLRFNPNRNAKELLERIIVTRLSRYLISQVENTVELKSYKCEHCGAENSLKSYEFMEKNYQRLFESGFIGDYVHIPFSARMITKEVRSILESLFLVMDFPNEYHKKKMEEEIHILDSGDSNNVNVASRKRLMSYCAELSNR